MCVIEYNSNTIPEFNKINWLNLLENIFENKSNNYDGYIKNINYLDNSVKIEFYLIYDDKMKKFCEKYGSMSKNKIFQNVRNEIIERLSLLDNININTINIYDKD